MGLHNSIFHTIISQIINMQPLPSVESAYSMVVREERLCLVTRGKNEQVDIVAFVARSNEKSSMFCSICAKTWHNAA